MISWVMSGVNKWDETLPMWLIAKLGERTMEHGKGREEDRTAM